MNLYENLHKKYDVSKTLRFELKPVGNTLTNIEQGGFIEKDEQRAIDYKKVKKYCDEYHKVFIERVLSNYELPNELLIKYNELYEKENKDIDTRNEIREIEGKLRKDISEAFKSDEQYKGIFSKDMIQKYLKELFKEQDDKIKEISEFDKFTTYFTGFNKNRENLYVEDEASTSIAHRLINENLPTFITNMKIYKKFTKLFPELKDLISSNLKVNNVEEMFELEGYNKVLSQTGIEHYNLLISGKSEEKTKIKGINEYVNEFNQKNKEYKIPKLKPLYKQILSDKTSESFAFESIDDDSELTEQLEIYNKEFFDAINGNSGIIQLLANLKQYQLDKIYINNNLDLTRISQEIFGDWNRINEILIEDYDKNYTGKVKVNTEKYEDERKKKLKSIEEYSIESLDKKIKEYRDEENKMVDYLETYITLEKVKNIANKYSECQKYLINTSVGEKKLVKNESAINAIKDYLDSVKDIQSFLKMFIPKHKTIETDSNFYNIFSEKYEIIYNIISLYNKTRNYLTQKPYSIEKIKINFNNPILLNGWDLNKEKDCLGVILIKDNKYYLGIINPYNKKIFDIEETKDEENVYKKMEYKLLPGANKMLPKVFLSAKGIENFKPSSEIIEGYSKGLHKKGENFNIEFCHKLIDFFKDSINKNEDWNKFEFKFSPTESYNDISEFYKEIEKQGYNIKFKKYSAEYIEKLVEIGDLFLFEIYNKDFSKFSKGKPNLHTLYWKALFSEKNLENIIYKLNGQAEIFYRKASLNIADTAVHPKNQPIKNKNDLNEKKESIFTYDLIKNKRYTVDKFQFHVPITMNFISEKVNNINESVNKELKMADHFNIIGIDRGERNLLYITVINEKGEILEQYSLNKIINEYNGKKYVTNYHDLLDAKEKERELARESWKTIENIKELKEGYLSQVIHKITELCRKYKAIIVIEDLNSGFKNSRIKVEKQVYQKFEKMLIDKLNYLIFKDEPEDAEGGVYNAYQLTNKFESFTKMGKQSGILFYIPAWCTSKIDPTTGFVNLFRIKYKNVNDAKEFIKKFEDIRYNEKDNLYEFAFNYKNFTNKAFGIKERWTICTYGNRIKTFRNKNKNSNWDNEEINLTEEFKKLFHEYNIDNSNLKEEILRQDDKAFFEELLALIKLTLQMRNSKTGTDIDYMISPVRNKFGEFYNSNTCSEQWPKDADANGAFNIARKGLMLVKQIKNTDSSKLARVKFNITNKEWLEFVQTMEN